MSKLQLIDAKKMEKMLMNLGFTKTRQKGSHAFYIQFRDGLPFTSIKVCFTGVSKVIENVVIDTGAAETIIL
jgi:hypothetical protein